MACSSTQTSSSASVTRKFDVFVSFRGNDTRYNFTDHHFGAFQRKGILAFRDDTKLRKGESIAPELLRAIEGSSVFIVVFSKNYASSTWCLRELEKILECAQLSRKSVLPIFCDVDPSEVRYQKRSYAEAFAKHEEIFKQDSEIVQRWRAAITQVANLSGWDLRDRPQYAEIERIVEEIVNILGHKFSSLPNDLVGMHSPIEELEELLLLDLVDDVRVVGICGMGGIGKSTVATTLYDKISHRFDACCFLDDLSQIYRQYGPLEAHKQILHQTLGEEHFQICNLYSASTLMRSRLRHVRALIILDNVDQIEQLEKLAVDREWLGAGSRIIIISRDEHILKERGVDAVYKVPLLNQANSLHLFCRKAFKRDNIMSNYEGLAYDILYYADGLPLAIKVLGSFLFGRDIPEWRSALARLRETPNKDIMDVLRLTFDGLDKMEKEIFLHIACFFNMHRKKFVKRVLNCCGFHPDIGLKVLIDKSLISISDTRVYSKSMIQMHGLLVELGKKIVQEDSTKELRKWSRLWDPKYFNNVMLENVEKNVEAIIMGPEVIILMAEELSKMSHLRLLILGDVILSGCLTCLSNELRYVKWHYYPLMYLPSSFQPNQLVKLSLRCSNIKQLWKCKKHLPNLRSLDLSHSENLIKMPDFGEVPNLERLNLEGCVKLVRIDPSIGVLIKLVYLNLKDCYGLRSTSSNIFGLNTLKSVNLSGLSKAFKNPVRHLKNVDTSESTSHSQSTSSTIFKWITMPFHSLYPRAHTDLLPSLALTRLSCLRELDISFCGLTQIPDAIGYLHWLERLNLGGNNFVTLPSLNELSKLEYLNLQHCKQLKSLPDLPPSPPAIEEDSSKGSKDLSDMERSKGLYILDCPELGDTERCSSMAFSWMIKFIHANQQSSYFDDISITIPGSEIPRWFNNQIMGGDLTIIDPFPIMHDNNIIGIACCAVLYVAPGDPTTTTNERSANPIVLGFGRDRCVKVIYRVSVCAYRKLISVKSNHMFLVHFSRETFFDILSIVHNTPWGLYDAKMQQTFIAYIYSPFEVINSGYHWVIIEDLQRMPCGNSLAQKRKFLAIEDEAEEQSSIILLKE